MNWSNEQYTDDVTLERIKLIEKRIEILEEIINRQKELFLEEDLKARGIQ